MTLVLKYKKMVKYIVTFGMTVLIITSCTNKEKSYLSNDTNYEEISLEDATLIDNEIINTPYGQVELQHNFITDESTEKLFDALDFQRASQAYIWSTPIVSFYTWIEEQNKNYKTGKLGEFAVFQSLKEKRGIVTENLTTPYIIQFYNLSNGPIEIEYPEGQTASAFLDLWQRPIGSMGLNGPDQGKGGTYILIGPEDDLLKYQKKGVTIYQSATNNIFIGMRIFDSRPEIVDKFKSALRMGKIGEEKVTTVFRENIDKEWSATARRDLDYWRILHDIINEEPVREQDKVWMAMLEPLGIAKGIDFKPNERQVEILIKGLKMGELMLRNQQINPRFAEPYWEGKNWYKSFDFTVPQITEYKVELDERAVWFYEAVTSTESMINPTSGKGQVYMTAKRDSEGNLFRADKTYKLTVPKNVPVLQFWALTLYSENTRRPYDNGGADVKSTSLDSKMEQLQYNEDGSIDLYIGKEAPNGMESNFMKTLDKDGWFVYFRLYAPTDSFFDKTFQLNDFELLKE